MAWLDSFGQVNFGKVGSAVGSIVSQASKFARGFSSKKGGMFGKILGGIQAVDAG